MVIDIFNANFIQIIICIGATPAAGGCRRIRRFLLCISFV